MNSTQRAMENTRAFTLYTTPLAANGRKVLAADGGGAVDVERGVGAGSQANIHSLVTNV